MAAPSSAKVVVVGGGIAGLSVAYHLARKAAWKEVLLIERSKLTSGTTWHAAGSMGRVSSCPRVVRHRKYGSDLFQELAASTGLETGYLQNGGLTIATDERRMDLLRRWSRITNANGSPCEIVSKEEALKLGKIMNCDDVIGGIWSPEDGQINPVDASNVMAAAAQGEGATILQDTPLQEVITKGNKIKGVRIQNSKGEEQFVECDKVVLCTGMWTRQAAYDLGASVPLWPCEHEYVLTEALPQSKGLPVIRTYDEYLYIKEDAGRLLIGLFEPNAKVAFKDQDRVPQDFSFGSFPDDLEHLEPYLMSALHRIPLLSTHGITSYFTGPESFTPDGTELLGECPEVDGLYVCAGFNSHGITCAPSAGQLIADLIDDGGLTFKQDWFSLDVRRNPPWMADLEFIKPRAAETLGRQYGYTAPHQSHTTGRNLIMTPFHNELANKGAVFGLASGMERPDWFEPPEDQVVDVPENIPRWYPHVQRETYAARNGVALFDQSSLSKVLVRGPHAAAVLQWVCSADVVRDVGQCVYTLMLNGAGGIENDCTVTRLEDDVFLVVAGSAMLTKTLDWIRRVADVKELGEYAMMPILDLSVLGIYGPKAAELLSTVTSTDFHDESMHRMGKFVQVDVTIGDKIFPLHAMRTGYTGAVGWELYLQQAAALEVYKAIANTGDNFGLIHAGTLALDTLRIEAGNLRYGSDMSSAETPDNVGLRFATELISKSKLNKQRKDFFGREALEDGVTTYEDTAKRVYLCEIKGIKRDEDPFLFGDDPIYTTDGGHVVGKITSCAYSFNFDTFLALVDFKHPSTIASSLYAMAGVGEPSKVEVQVLKRSPLKEKKK
eukprot:m.25409 g.25409  ORF g.25409 m.25409 type:complete len:836 (-) comp7703_c0_seq1:117-2624(-)